MVLWNVSVVDVCGHADADTFFCTRYVTLSIVSVFTGLLCVAKLAKYHYKKVKCPYQLSIFYCALLECVFFTLHWIVLPYDVVDNIGYWFRVMQLLIICFLYSKLASRVLNAEVAYKRRYLPVLTMFALYYGALIPWMFTIPRFNLPHKCTEFHHPCYTVSDFVLSQIFLVCGVYLTRKMALVNMPSEQFLEQQKQLWGVVLSFETEAIISIVYDVLLSTIGAEHYGCGGFLYQDNAFSVLAFVLIRSLRLFVAIWFMLYMFDARSTDYSEAPAYNMFEDDGEDEDDDPLDLYRPDRIQSIIPYDPESVGFTDDRAGGNIFENYIQANEEERFGERTNRQLQLSNSQ